MFIRDSRRSYKAYSYAGLILITDLFSVGTPVGVTELILITDLCLFRTPVGVIELIRRTDLCLFRTPVGVTELILIQNLYLYRLMFIQDSCRSYRTYSYTEVLVSTTKLILVLCISYLYYKVYPGLTGLILVFRIREYP